MKNNFLKLIVIIGALVICALIMTSCDISSFIGMGKESAKPEEPAQTYIPTDDEEEETTTVFVEDTAAGLYETGSNFTKQLKPWSKLVSEGLIVVEDGVVVEADESVSGDILISKNMTEIGATAFFGNPNIINVKIPDSVVKISRDAFYNCENLETVELGKGVIYIESDAFSWCKKLETIYIPASVKDIQAGAFFMCDSLVSIEVETQNTAYKSIDGNLYTKDGSMILQYAPGKADNHFVLSDDVTAVGGYAFGSAKNLQVVLLSDGVTSLGQHAFDYCINLTSIYLGRSLESIGSSAFSASGLCEVILPDTVESIAAFAFAGCANLERVTVSESLKNMDEGVFAECGMLKEFIADESNEVYESVDGILYSENGRILVAYAPGKSDMSFQIPYSVEVIADYAFYSCDNLRDIYLHNAIDSVGDRAFFECDSLENIDIPYGVKSLGDGALGGCDALVSLTIPNSIEKLGADVFMWNTGLRHVNYEGSLAEWYEIEKGAEWTDGTPVLYSVHCNNGDVIIPGN